MLDDESTPTQETTPQPEGSEETATSQPAKKAAKKAPAKKAAAKKAPAKKTTAKKTTAKKTTKKAAAKAAEQPAELLAESPGADTPTTESTGPTGSTEATPAADAAGEAPAVPPAAPALATAALFQPPDPAKATPRKRPARKQADPKGDEGSGAADRDDQKPDEKDDQKADQKAERQADADSGDEDGDGGQRRRRRRGGRRRRKADGEDSGADAAKEDTSAGDKDTGDKDTDDKQQESSSGSRRRRRRRRQGEDGSGSTDDPENTVVRVREPRQTSDNEISGVTGSTRLEAKKQRRREGREAGRRRAPIVSEAEFLARREAVDREMVVRQRKDVTQIGVLEDDVLVEHYVARESQTSLIGNVYLGRVQNVLPSMEAAFIDIGKGRNAVLYAGEVNWGVLGKEGQPRRIETALKSGQPVLVQVTKDPVGHKGARLTSQISLPGRYLVYLPGGQTSGISRKLPDTERNRLKNLLKEILPDDAGVIIRTAAEGASEDELRRDVTRLTARWEDIDNKVQAGQAPQMLYGEPDLMIKVIRDLFTEDFKQLVVSGSDAWDMIEGYVSHVAPDLMERVQRWTDDSDVFASYRVDEQIAKALERKVWLPSGGSLVIDRTEAMTVVDVNTGKFTGSGGNLEETVTKNNLEAAEEIVRQLRLRDIGGIIVVDFIDMVLESNRDLVLRRLIECLGRDRTRHQVAEITSLGLVQMTRKRIGTGLLEAFSEQCESCNGRGVHTHVEPVEPKKSKQDSDDSRRGGRRSRRGGGDDKSGEKGQQDRAGADKGQQDRAGADNGRSGNDSRPDRADKADKADQPAQADQAPAAKDEKAADRPSDEKAADEQTRGERSVGRRRRASGGKTSARAASAESAEPAESAGAQASGTRSSEVGAAAEGAVPEAQPAGTGSDAVAPGEAEVQLSPWGAEPASEVPEQPEAASQSGASRSGASQSEASESAGPEQARQPEPAAAASDGVPAAQTTDAADDQPAPPRRTRRRAATRPAGPPQPTGVESG